MLTIGILDRNCSSAHCRSGLMKINQRGGEIDPMLRECGSAMKELQIITSD